MAKGMSQIHIGVIDPKQDTLGITTKAKELAEKIAQEVGNLTDTMPLSSIVSQVTEETLDFVLDRAEATLKTEEVEKVLAEQLKGSGFTVEQIEASLEVVRNAIKDLPLISNEMMAVTYGDVKKLMQSSLFNNK